MQNGSTSEAEETARQTGSMVNTTDELELLMEENRHSRDRDDHHGNLAALARSGRSSTAD